MRLGTNAVAWRSVRERGTPGQMGKGRPMEGREAPRVGRGGGGAVPVQLSLNPSPDDASSG